jgi:predicted ATP-grasp superfamily ATP-dependent carboligase
VARSRYADAVLNYPSPRNRPNDFLAWVADACRRFSVAALLPLSESTTHLLAAEPLDLGDTCVIGPTLEQYSRICDKEGLARTAASVGVATPPGAFVGSDGRTADWPPLPSIVKPPASATPTARGVVYTPAVLVETPEQRTDAVNRLTRESGAALVQEVIRGERFRIHFVRHREGLSAVALRTVRSYPRATGMSSVSLSIPLPAEAAEATSKLLDLIDFRGLGSSQFIKRGDALYLHDVNLRIAYSLGAEIQAGLDAPRLSVDDALGRPLHDAHPQPRLDRHYVWLGGETRALMEALRNPSSGERRTRIARDLLLAALSPSRILDPFSLSDPLPTIGGLAAAFRRGRRSADVS